MTDHNQVFRHWPPQLPEAAFKELLTHAIDWSLANGLIMRGTTKEGSGTAVHAPFALFPSPYPQEAYQKAVNLQPIFNRLVHEISEDWEFLDPIFEE